MNDEDLISDILLLAEDHDWFDTKFVESIYDQLQNRKSISVKQRESLENIHSMLKRKSEDNDTGTDYEDTF